MTREERLRFSSANVSKNCCLFSYSSLFSLLRLFQSDGMASGPASRDRSAAVGLLSGHILSFGQSLPPAKEGHPSSQDAAQKSNVSTLSLPSFTNTP